MNDTLQYVEYKQWEHKDASGDQLAIRTCPFCLDDRYHFYMNKQNGMWDCKKCGESGNLYQLKAKLGDLNDITKVVEKKYKPLDSILVDKAINNLKNDKNAYDYLLSRGFTPETIEFFKLGVESGWITIPHFQDGKLWNFKQRNYVQKEFRRIAGQPTVLFNIDNIKLDKKSILIVESETDCIAAWQMGYRNVVGLTAGAESFMPEWIPFIQQFKTVYVCLNSDEVGQKGAYKIAEKIGFSKCRNVLLPIKDVNDILKENRIDDLKNAIANSTRFKIKNVSSISDYVKDLDKWLDSDGSVSGLEIEFVKLNSILQGFKEEDLIILSGDSGVGKTTFCLNLLYQFLNKGKKCLGFFLEGKIMYYIMRMMSIDTKKPYADLRIDPLEWDESKKKFSDFEMYFYSGAQAELDPKRLKELLAAAVQLHDIQFVMIDNLQKYVRASKDVVNETSRAVSDLKDLAVDLKIPILLIAHVRKPDKDQKRVTMHDAKSSSTIYQDADVYITIWNNKKDKENSPDDYKISIDKNRMGEGGIDINFEFDKRSATFSERIIPLIDESKKEEKKSKKQATIVDLEE